MTTRNFEADALIMNFILSEGTIFSFASYHIITLLGCSGLFSRISYSLGNMKREIAWLTLLVGPCVAIRSNAVDLSILEMHHRKTLPTILPIRMWRTNNIMLD